MYILNEFNNESFETTVNVGIAQGGNAGNVVPSFAKLNKIRQLHT